MLEQVESLEDHPHPLAQFVDGITVGGDVFPFKQNFAGSRHGHHVDGPQQGAFAAPGGSDDANHFAFVDLAADIFQHIKMAAIWVYKCFGKVSDADHNKCFMAILNI